MKFKKGIIFSLDGAIAVTVVLIMLINTTYYFTTTSKESLSQTQIIKRGYDVLAMFDYFEQLDNVMRVITPSDDFVPNTTINGLNVSNYLPNGYEMTVFLDDARKTACGGCVLDSANAITALFNIEGLNEGGNLYFQVNAQLTAQTTTNPSFSVRHNGIDYALTGVCLTGACTYTTTSPITGLISGSGNQIQFVRDGSNDFTINWFRVLDDSGYTLSTATTAPDDRFIGTGERWYAAFDSNGHFEGLHRARFSVWIA